MKKITARVPSVTVAVSAFNEAANIKQFLHSVLTQKQIGFRLKEILVISDGSSDDTISLIKSIKSPLISLVIAKKRLGKSTRLNEIYRRIKSDILVQSDCDVVFAHKRVIFELVQSFRQYPQAVMLGGNPKPFAAKTFIEQAINTSVRAFISFRDSVYQGHNVFSVDGRLLAFKKSFYKSLRIPSDMIANDAFAYYVCKSRGLEYRFVRKATVWFRSPQTLRDHLRQNVRFLAAPIRMKRYFDPELIDHELSIPPGIYWQTVVKEGIKHPVHSLAILLINRLCALMALLEEKKLTARWPIAISTKKLFVSK